MKRRHTGRNFTRCIKPSSLLPSAARIRSHISKGRSAIEKKIEKKMPKKKTLHKDSWTEFRRCTLPSGDTYLVEKFGNVFRYGRVYKSGKSARKTYGIIYTYVEYYEAAVLVDMDSQKSPWRGSNPQP